MYVCRLEGELPSMHANCLTVSRPSTPPAVNPFNPDWQILSLAGLSATGSKAGCAVVISCKAVACPVTGADVRLAGRNVCDCSLSLPFGDVPAWARA